MNPPDDDLARLALLSPADGPRDPATAGRLIALRDFTDARRNETSSPAPALASVASPCGPVGGQWRRRGLLLGAAAAAAVVIPVVGGIVSPGSMLGLAGTPSAVAEDGRLDCGTGYGEAVDPATVGPRYLPASLPEGLNYVSVFARDNTARGWCSPPSLSALATGVDDRVDATLKVYGPFDVRLDDSGMGTAFPSTVAGHEARLFVHEDQEAEGVLFYRWFFTDDDTGQTWLAEVDGYSLEEASTIVDGLVTTQEHVTWTDATYPGLDVVHQRSGAPYSLDSHHESWDINISDGQREYLISVDQRLDNHAVPLFADATVGSRLTSADGLDVIQDPIPEGTEDGDGDGRMEQPLASVWIELAPGLRAQTAAATTALGTELLSGLELARPDDERIEQYGRL